ncbi:Fur family transcriptional regulator [Rhodococcus rhodochrous]|uniref:Fur family transcriptional regulator n=1 Tax=Rhodococcus rhodochrous KG-21 TaxID=1441923 RepID=A0A0M9WNL3_RHORH|nr:Fur family transcriptional regulator [Rhodococcus rhodochrous]KOS55740.1 Fur family transcriptional regulator [Rhodococcus rhodochrous KG-21]
MHRTGEPVDTRAQLRAAGLRVTAPRVAVLGAVAAHPHSDADEIAAAVRSELGSVSTQAVYDVLKACVGAGLLRRIEPAGSPARYETRIGDNHHHLVCRNCGAVTDIDCAVGAAPCLEPSDDHGYSVDEAEVTFWGLCPDCRES